MLTALTLPYLGPSVQEPPSYCAYACAYAQIGWHVFPVEPWGKLPLPGSHGLLDATTDPAQIARWWNENPWANIGVNCGLSGLLVIDVDPRNGGLETLSAWVAEHGVLPTTLRARTPSGGFHAYFLLGDLPLPRKGRLGPGVDLQGAGAYVVVPPSQTLKGEYVWQTS